MTHRVEHTTDPAAFLALAGEHLAADPVLATVVTTVAQRAVGAPVPDHPQWWVSVLDGERVVGVAMRTASFAPYPLYVLPMPEAAALALGRWLHERGEDATAVNGAQPAAGQVLAALAGPRGEVVEEVECDRLWEVRTVVDPPPVPGRARQARLDEVDLVASWTLRFMPEADAQAGRAAREGEGSHLDAAWATDRIGQGLVWLWEVDGEPVHLSAHSVPAYGVGRVGPVYTPPEHRGHGYASALVAHVSRLLLDQGARACLFTDRDNPVSNGVYARLGYEPQAEMARLVTSPVTTPGPA